MTYVLVDAGPLYAIAVSSDQYHDRARQEMEHLSRDGISVMMSHPTLLETYSLILRRSTLPVAHSWLIEVTANVKLINPTSVDYRQASVRVRRYADQPITLFDALVVVMSERLAIPIWTFDHHFDVMRASVWR